MANIKSAKKRIKVITKKTLRNKMIKSQTKTAIKKVLVAVNAGDKEAATATLKGAVSAIDRAYTKGVYHKNTAARKKSSLTRMVNGLYFRHEKGIPKGIPLCYQNRIDYNIIQINPPLPSFTIFCNVSCNFICASSGIL